MSVELQSVIGELNELLPYVARDAERYRNTSELVRKSHELHLAAAAIDRVLPHPSLASLSSTIRVRIGEKPVEAYSTRSLPYDFIEILPDSAQPGEEHDLRFRRYVQTDIFNPHHVQPVYGQLRYFDLATLGRILEEGGELNIREKD